MSTEVCIQYYLQHKPAGNLLEHTGKYLGRLRHYTASAEFAKHLLYIREAPSIASAIYPAVATAGIDVMVPVSCKDMYVATLGMPSYSTNK